MQPKIKQLIGFAGVLLLAVIAAWITYPKGSKVDLNAIKIPYKKEFKINLGLDLQGGSHLVYQANFDGIAESDRGEALNSVRDVIERRVNSFGVSEPLVQVSGSDRIIVELPGIKDINEAIKQIGQTPYLEFMVQNPNIPIGEPDESGAVTIDESQLWVPTGLSGKQLKRATVDFQAGTAVSGEPVVRLEFNEEGRQLFSEITSANIGKPVAIILDGQAISAPTVNASITDGIAIISGQFTTEQARELATRLNSGALPVPIELISQQNVGATLGKESVHKSVIAGILGLVLIALFMVSFYRFPGLLSVFALLIYTLISIAVFKVGVSSAAVILFGVFFFLSIAVNWRFGIFGLLSYVVLMLSGSLVPVTLTLAGIAGFILSIGMAVDANILIFERLKEEIRSGKDISKAVEDGFDRAWLSIRDSNISSLITTSILYTFGTPSIKGFALTLSIGILISMFTAISVTRTFLKLFIGNNIALHPWLFGVSKTKHE